MIGVVGDLGEKRIMAWEISPEIDLDILENEIKYYVPSFVVTSLSSDELTFKFNWSLCSVNVSDFLFVDLNRVDSSNLDFLKSISKTDFLRRFKRRF